MKNWVLRGVMFGLILAGVNPLWAGPAPRQQADSVPEPQTGTLLLQVGNVQPGNGSIRVAVYALDNAMGGQSGWQGEPQYHAVIEGAIAGKPARHEFVALPFGRYSIKLFQDLNGNQSIDVDPASGLPVEPFGFSGASAKQAGIPTLKEAAVDFRQSGQVIELALVHIKQAAKAGAH